MKALLMIAAVVLLATPNVFAKSSNQEFKLTEVIEDTEWEWNGPNANEKIVFKRNGYIGHPGWERRGLATSWQVIDEHTVLLVIEKGRKSDRYAILVFNEKMTKYSGFDFHNLTKIRPSTQIK